MAVYKSALKALSLSVAAAALTSGAAFAATPIYAGGGTYAYSALRVLGDCAGAPALGDTATPAGCAANAALPYVYEFAGVGSGGGIEALIGETSPTAAASSGGADAANGVSYPYAKWTFTDSDAPLDSVSETDATMTWYAQYKAAPVLKNRGAVWQVPEAAAGMGLPYNLTGASFVNGPSISGVTAELDLTKDAVCYIYTNETAAGAAVAGARTWDNAIFYSASKTVGKKTTVTQLGSNLVQSSVAGLPIVAIHRPDASGSTYIFTLWLQTNCKGYSAAGYTAPGTLVTWPSYVTAATSTGGGGIQSYVVAHTGSIGYVDPSKFLPIKAGLNAAFVASSAATVTAPDFVYPSIAGIKAAFANISAPVHNSAYSAWGTALNKKFFKGGKGAYPITGLTYIMGYQCYSSNSSANYFDGVTSFINFLTTNGSAEALFESKGIVGMGPDQTKNADGNTFLQAEQMLLTDTVNSAKTAIIGLNDSQIGTFGKGKNGPKACPNYFTDANRT